MDDVRPTGIGSGIYRCGTIEIDAVRRHVLIDGTPAKIGARAFDVLLALVERRERVVSKHELMDLVWPNLVVEENNLLVHMVALRKLLGPRAIATIPGRGYRFALPIDAVSGGGLAESCAAVGRRSAAISRRRRRSSVARRTWTPWMRCCASTRSCRSSAPPASARRAWRWRPAASARLRIAGRTLVGGACADQRGHAGPEQHRRSARDAASCRSAAAGSACHRARESEPAARSRQLRAPCG